VALPKARADVILPPILLSSAGELHVMVERDTERYPTLRVRLTRKEGRQQTPVTDAALDATTTEWIAKELDEGDYVVTLSGTEPQQRLAQTVKIVAGETAKWKATIEPIELTGTVTRASRGVNTPTLTLKASPAGWTAAITGDSEGRFRSELWQTGRFLTSVAAPELQSPYSFLEELAPVGKKIDWNISVPSGMISGIVLDAKSKRAVPGASVTLDSELRGRDVTSSLGTTTDESGRFTFEGIAAGTHTLSAEAEMYTAHRTAPFTLATDDEHKQVELPLARANRQAIIVTGSDQLPLSGALVLHEGAVAPSPPVSDATGRAILSVEPGTRPALLVLPRTGSFAVTRFLASDDEPMRVVVAPPMGSLIVRTLDEESGAPIGNIRILLRYNGEFVTPQLADMAARYAGMKSMSDASGTLFLPGLPAGTYELWPYSASREADQILRGGVRPAAIVGISAGEYTVRLKFRVGAISTNAGAQ
jgi:hypothetical protein